MALYDRYVPHLTLVEPVMMPNDWIEEMVLYQAENAHQVAELTLKQHYPATIPSQDWWQPGGSVWTDATAVHFKWGLQSNLSANFYGYVASAQVVNSERHPSFLHIVQLTVRYTLVGVSMTMQSVKNRLWPATTLSAIARQIAFEHSLQPRVETSSVRFEQRMQVTSDWAFLSEICDYVGYRVYVDETALWFVSRDVAQPTGDPRVPKFELWKAQGSFNSLRSFESTAGETDPVGGVRARYETVSLNRRTGQLMPATYTQPRSKPPRAGERAPLLTQFWSQRPSTSYDRAVNNIASQVEWLWVESQCTVTGDSRLRPGALVELGGNGIGTENSGTWMVRSVTHRFKPNWFDMVQTDYQCDVVLGRNQIDRIVLPVSAQLKRFGETVLVNGRWRAQYMDGTW